MPAVDEILSRRVKPLSSEDREEFYRKILVHVTISAAMGSPTDLNVLKQTRDALESVFPPMELDEYVTKKEDARLEMLAEKVQLVRGIRLFYQYLKKNQAGLDETVLKGLRDLLERIDAIVKQNTFVPTYQIYPLFKELGSEWATRRNVKSNSAGNPTEPNYFTDGTSIQTDVHPPSEHQGEYHFSEWHYRKLAFEQLKARNQNSTVTQTHDSTYKRDVSTQHWVPKDQETITRKDNGTQPPMKLRDIIRTRNPLTGRVEFREVKLEY